MSSWITSDWAKELRALWNKYDPIGVYHFEGGSVWSEDEYDSYHGIVLKHFNENSTPQLLSGDLRVIVTDRMGLNWNADLEAMTKQFARECFDWYASKANEINR